MNNKKVVGVFTSLTDTEYLAILITDLLMNDSRTIDQRKRIIMNMLNGGSTPTKDDLIMAMAKLFSQTDLYKETISLIN